MENKLSSPFSISLYIAQKYISKISLDSLEKSPTRSKRTHYLLIGISRCILDTL